MVKLHKKEKVKANDCPNCGHGISNNKKISVCSSCGYKVLHAVLVCGAGDDETLTVTEDENLFNGAIVTVDSETCETFFFSK